MDPPDRGRCAGDRGPWVECVEEPVMEDLKPEDVHFHCDPPPARRRRRAKAVVKTTIRLDPWVHAHLVRLAMESNRSLNAQINKMLEGLLTISHNKPK